LGEYISPIKKQTQRTEMAVGRDDKRKRFHIIFKVNKAEIPVPPELRKAIKELRFDFSCGIKFTLLAEAFKEAERLVADGYEEEEAPCGI
jgi:hypothetical protein